MDYSSADGAVCRDLVFMCADTGAVVAMTYTDEKRPALARAVVFLTSGDTLWVDGARGSGTGVALAVRDRGSAGQHDLRLSARARLLTRPGYLVSGETAARPHVPVGIELAFEPASQQLALGPGAASAGRVTLVRGAGSLAVGSVIHRVEGAAWSATGPGGGPGELANCRARAVFQDGSALYVAGETGEAASPGSVAVLVHNTRIRAAAVRDLAARGAARGRSGRTVSWAGDGRSPADAAGEIRDPEQQVTVTRPDPAGSGWLSWSCSPFVFVRSGITGLGLVERRTRVATADGAAEPANELPDPF